MKPCCPSASPCLSFDMRWEHDFGRIAAPKNEDQSTVKGAEHSTEHSSTLSPDHTNRLGTSAPPLRSRACYLKYLLQLSNIPMKRPFLITAETITEHSGIICNASRGLRKQFFSLCMFQWDLRQECAQRCQQGYTHV